MKKDLIVVGIGASAGGLEAIQSLFDNIPDNTGMAFVIVQHLSPNFKSMMDELLQKHTKMPVQLAKENIKLQPDNIYLNPKEKNIVLEEGKIKYVDKLSHTPLNLPIDLFFHSLGNSLEEHAIGIILSGTGTDGSRGIGTIKGLGGSVIVQKPESAQFDGMPVTAINSGNAEFIATPEEMGAILREMASNLFVMHNKQATNSDKDGYDTILDIIYGNFGVNFKLYKDNTIIRRIEKRIAVHQLTSFKEYAKFLKENSVEQELLGKACLIGVTRYFRDPEAYDAIKEKVLPALFNEKTRNDRIVRIWVSACSTGEEAYSMAILIDQYLNENNLNIAFKIFATDIDKGSIQIASEGRYPVNYVADIPKPFLEKYFIKNGDTFEIIKRIREKIVFSQHNLLSDPPFIKLDFITCRNLLIYLLQKIQHKVIGTFQFGLNKGGFLFLGHSETLGDSQKMFKTIDRQWRVYESIVDYRELPSRQQSDVRLKNYDAHYIGYEQQHKNIPKVNTAKFFTEQIAREYGPTCVFIAKNFEILFVNGDINEYVEFPQGLPKYNLLDILADDKLKAMVRSGVRRVYSEMKKVVFKDIPFIHKNGNAIATLSFQIQKLENLNEPCVLVGFEKSTQTNIKEDNVVYGQYKLDEFSKHRIDELETDLKKNEQELQNTIEELETSNEELQASNEELQASNEELQSTNEELQSVNEELYTVNAEVQVKNKELLDLNDDVINILNSTNIGILFLDADLRIRKFTPALREHFCLTENDMGRPISNFAANFTEWNRKDFINDVHQVLATGEIIEKEFNNDDNSYYIRKTSPFISSDDTINGVVVSFVDITNLKDSELKFKSLFDNQIGGIAVCKLIYNKNGVPIDYTFTEINKQLEVLLNRKRKDIIEKKASEVIPDFKKNYKDVLHAYAEVSETGIANEFDLYIRKSDIWQSIKIYSHQKGFFVTITYDITLERKATHEIENARRLGETITANLPYGISLFDKEGNCILSNKLATSMFGFGKAKGKKQDYFDLRLWKTNKLFKDAIKALKTGNKITDVELFTDNKGNEKHIEYIFDSFVFNRKTLVMFNFQDITELINSGLALSESKQKYKLLFEKINEGFAHARIITDDKGKPIDWKYIDVNPAFEHQMGLKRNDIVGKRIKEILPNVINDTGNSIGLFGGVALGAPDYYEEKYLPPVDKWFAIHVFSPVENEFATTFTDITERKIQEQQMIESEAFLKSIFTSSDVAIVVIKVINEKEFVYEGVNPSYERMTGLESRWMKGKTPESLIDSIGRKGVDSIIQNYKRCVEKRAAFEYEEELTFWEEKTYWISRLTPLFDNDMKIIRLVGNSTNITDRKQTEQELKEKTSQLIQSEKMSAIGTMVAGVAHELNNPLMGIMNYADYCKNHVEKGGKLYNVLSDLQDEAKKSANIITDLLTFSRKEDHSVYQTNVVKIIHSTLRLLKLKIKDKHIDFVLPDKTISLEANINPGYLQQIIFNLIDNAVYAVENSPNQNKQIKIETLTQNNTCIISITDTGIGIPATKLNNVYDPFYTTKPVGKGTGLGLTICKNIIDGCNGKITMESEEMAGTTVTIKIPQKD